MPKSKFKFKDVLILGISFVASLSVLAFAISFLLKTTVNSPAKANSSQKLQTSSLTIGILTSSTKYNDLASYLRSQFGNKVQVTIDGNESISYEDVKNRLAHKELDIVFAQSPMLSVAAKDNGYTFAARMFPDTSPYYQGALFVKSSSKIQSLNDLKPTTTIALGDFNSASSFYMPAYDLFGKTLQVNMGHRSSKIREMVRAGQADVGAAAYDAVKKDTNLRVIHLSRYIPGSNVYLSPNISDSDKEMLKKALLDAPIDIKKQANYDVGEEPDYSNFIKISQKAEEVLRCADFKQITVDFYCSNSSTRTTTLSETKNIEGRINGWSHKDASTEQFSLSGVDNQVYLISIPRKIMNQISGASSPLAMQGKHVRVVSVIPEKVRNGNFEFKITQPNQLVVL